MTEMIIDEMLEALIEKLDVIEKPMIAVVAYVCDDPDLDDAIDFSVGMTATTAASLSSAQTVSNFVVELSDFLTKRAGEVRHGIMSFSVEDCFSDGHLSDGTIEAAAEAIFERFTDEIRDRGWAIRIPSQSSFTSRFYAALRDGVEAELVTH